MIIGKIGNAFLAVRRQPYMYRCSPWRRRREKGRHFNSLLSLVIKIKVVQNVIRMSLLSLVIKRKVVQNVKRMSENIISVSQYLNMSVCQYVRRKLFSLGIKMKVVHNVIRMSDSQKILVRKSLRTAK